MNNINFISKVPPQNQVNRPGVESLMDPVPIHENEEYKNSNRLNNKVALITGGDSGIGKAVAIAFAKEGADISIIYLNEHEDANNTKNIIENLGRKCIIQSGDITDETFCNNSVQNTIEELGKLNIVVNNAGDQFPQNSIEDITKEQLEKTFKTNVFSMFYITKASMSHLEEGDSIINTASVTAYAGNETLIDYSSSKGAVVSFTRSLALSLAKRKIRVNAVAPGPIWTPLIPSSLTIEKVGQFGQNVPFQRPGQPVEVAPAYVFLASSDASYITGEVIHINGGKIING